MLGLGGFNTWTRSLVANPIPDNVTDVVVLGADGLSTMARPRSAAASPPSRELAVDVQLRKVLLRPRLRDSFRDQHFEDFVRSPSELTPWAVSGLCEDSEVGEDPERSER